MKVAEERPQLVVVEGMQISTPLDPYLDLRALATYAGMSVRMLRDKLIDPHHPLPHYRLPGAGGKTGKLLVRRSDFDTWMAHYRRVGDPEVGRIVDEVLRAL